MANEKPYTFGAGRIGVSLDLQMSDEHQEVVVSSVDPGTQADTLGVPVGGVLLSLSGPDGVSVPIKNMSVRATVDVLSKMQRPVTFIIRDPSTDEAEFKAVQAAESRLELSVPSAASGGGVRMVKVYKETQSIRLGITFHSTMPEGLADILADSAPYAGSNSQYVIPIIKKLDKMGIAGKVAKDGNATLYEGDQVLSINGITVTSNLQAAQMLRDAVGEVILAVRKTMITQLPYEGLVPVGTTLFDLPRVTAGERVTTHIDGNDAADAQVFECHSYCCPVFANHLLYIDGCSSCAVSWLWQHKDVWRAFGTTTDTLLEF